MNFPGVKIKLFKRALIRRTDTWRLGFLLVLAFSFTFLELYEYFWMARDPYHLLELGIYFTFIMAISVLIEVSVRSKRAYMRMTKILKFKHNLSMELALKEDWSVLTAALVAIPPKISDDVEEVFFLIRSSPRSMLEIAAHWENGGGQNAHNTWNPLLPCPICMRRENEENRLHLHPASDDETCIYCFPIKNSGFPDAIFRMKLLPGSVFSVEEEEIFANIGDEVAVSLRASQDRKRLLEMQMAEVAITERHAFSTYVHDQLGQNLGYLHLKLDQLNSDEKIVLSKELRDELRRLQDVANASYEIVRDILKKTHPETIPHLTNVLREHAKTIAERSHFELHFESIGKPMHLLPECQRTVFYVFREILSNIEKHAAATQVEVCVVWKENCLEITVTDNGKGFDPALISSDEHFGLEIMQDRISTLEGQIQVTSSPNVGTTVSLAIPIHALNLVKT